MQTVEDLGDWSGLEPLRPVLHSFLGSRCRDDNEVQDIIQETFIRAARYRAGLAQPARLKAWLLRIASNVLRDTKKRASRHACVSLEASAELADGLAPTSCEQADDGWVDLDGEEVDRDTAMLHLRSAYRGLRARDQRVLASYYGGEESCAATARECGISPALVKVRLFRARRRLEQSVKRNASAARVRRLVAV